ncbi:farnesyl diphosphate synthase [Loktanella atrilutea]|uniref:Geranylgeranyl diphosphate synthase n=1 Tax=Loktanella atrilutea TaxID=366533 RepID=A0A1M4YWU4_LOKAT|nr:farnesyl diphosphate synthase [Loktanella atrilutea]
MTFANQLALDATTAQRLIELALTPVPDVPLRDAMLYAVQGGKGLRAFLVLEGARLHDVGDRAGHAAAAIEALHAYSLVHDDLPAMDDDDVRRGRPTVHRQWDEATAILVGDALQSLAFEMICAPGSGVSDAARATLALTLAQAAGAHGMVLGQALDIAAENGPPLTLDQITTLQAGKTGALITWACCCGPRICQSDIAPLKTYGDALGLAFQIADDILDETGDATAVGKAVGKDAAAGKATFVSLLGLDGARRRAGELVDAACDALGCYGQRADTLKDAARFVIARDK